MLRKKLRSRSPSDDPIFDKTIFVEPSKVRTVDDYLECLACGSDDTMIYDDGIEDTVGRKTRTKFISGQCMSCNANIYGEEITVVEDVHQQPVLSFNSKREDVQLADPERMSAVRDRYIRCLSCGTGYLEDGGELEIQDNTCGCKTEITEDIVGFCPVCNGYTLHTQYYDVEDVVKHNLTKLDLLMSRIKKHIRRR